MKVVGVVTAGLVMKVVGVVMAGLVMKVVGVVVAGLVMCLCYQQSLQPKSLKAVLQSKDFSLVKIVPL